MTGIRGPGTDPWDINYSDLENMKDLSAGNFGVVYKAQYFGTDVAVKKLLDVDDTFMHKYIEREMAILKSLRHPNIVQFMGLCKHSSGLYIITEFVGGGDLRHMLKDKAREMPWKLRVKMAMDIAHALTYLHSRGCIHRDIKSHNLLVEPDSGKLKLCDFGFSRSIETEDVMTLCGTDEWMAPEVMLGQRYDSKADVFSYGMVLIEFVTRHKPVKRQPGRKYAVDVELLRQSSPKDTPAEFLQLAIDCAVWDADKRPQMKDCLDVLKALYERVKELDKQQKSAAKQGDMTYMSTVIVEDDSENNDSLPSPTAAASSSAPAAAPPAQKPTPDTVVRQVRIGKGYKAEKQDELTLKAGDLVAFRGHDDQGWAQGELGGNIGWFPVECIDPASLPASESAGAAAVKADPAAAHKKKNVLLTFFGGKKEAKSKTTK